ncbi:MAG: flagellar basal body P-ring protein FlgI, partial [Planctomycetota bacterium]|nr:flagellar basal body P-ring protein FlgI [Planctomycetota bacterium]
MVNARKTLPNLSFALSLAWLFLVACQPTVERLEDSAPAAARVRADFRLDVPQVMRGTVAQESILVGFEPVAVEGYGLVVGLDGTGCTTMPPDLRAHMSADMTRRGIGPSGSQGSAPPPERMLNDPRTAVVIVRGTLPPGANARQKRTPGTQFDLEVIIDPRTDATSLLGGRLYTCDLRPASGSGLPPTGSRQADALGEGKGPLFVNPFALRGSDGRELIDLTRARIIGGGEATKRVPLRLRLASPSHARSRMIASAVNARFPQDPGMRDDVARGESDEMISIAVPPRWSQDTTTFAQLLRHTTIQQARQEASAALVAREVQRNPRMALDAAWRWRAMGPKALATTRGLYDAPERRVREAALKAGAWLDDPLVLPHLEVFAESEDPELRRLAAVLMAELPWVPRLEFALTKLVDDAELDIRLAAYEALVDLGSSTVRRVRFHPEFEVDLVDSTSPL